MRIVTKWMLAGCLAVIAPVAARADFVQIPGVYVPKDYGGATAAISTYDTGDVDEQAGELRYFSVAYDNFSLTTAGGISGGQLTKFTWLGKYDLPDEPRTNTFRLSIYNDNNGLPATTITAPTPIAFHVVTAEETSLGNLGGEPYYQYSAHLPVAFDMVAGTKYWLSITGSQDWAENGFAWSFITGQNDGGYFQGQEQNLSINSFGVDSDFAFNASITAVPEPSSCLLLAGAIGTIGIRKWRARRKVAA